MYRVLLVDDDPHIQTTNSAFLKKQGYEVYLAETGTEALRIAETTALDGVVLDVDIPGMDGITLCRRLRELSGIPVIFLSAYAQTDDRIKGLIAGGDDYLENPIPWWSWNCGCGCGSSAIITLFRIRSSSMGPWRSIWACGRCGMGTTRFRSRPWSLISFPFWRKTPTRCFLMSSSITACGDPP